MYSVQHVLWRGAMALSLLVVGGLGAGMSPQSAPASLQNEYACEDTHFVFDGVRGLRHRRRHGHPRRSVKQASIH